MAGGCLAASEHQIDIELSINEALLDKGEVVILSVATNISGQSAEFLPWNTPFDSQISADFFQVNRVSGDNLLPVTYQGVMIKRQAPVRGDYVTLASGESLSNVLSLSDSYPFCAGERYVISFERGLYTQSYAEINVKSSNVEFVAGTAFSACE